MDNTTELNPVETPKRMRPPVLLSPRRGTRAFWDSAVHEWRYLGLCFLVPALIMWLIYICMQAYPFGEESVLVLDLNGQYVYFFEGLRDILRGDGSLLYSFKRALGGEFFGIFAYYLASPFSLIVLLFPKKMITEALLVMFLLKTGACGLTFGIYIEATRKRNRMATVLFATMYALCGYAVVMQHNTMWIDNLILLPMVMLGIENLIRFGKWRLYVISLVWAVFSNFYIGYMMCIFAAAYFFYAYFSRTPEERNPLGQRFHFLKSGGRFALYSLIAVAICGALLLTTYYSLHFGKTDFSTPNYAFDQKFDWLDFTSKFFVGSYDTVRPEGLPFVYSGMLTLILMPLYFFAPHVRTREKVASGIFILFFLVSFNITTFDLFWHGMQRPNWLNYRYSFMLCFFIILLAYKAFERLREIGYRKVVGVCAAIALLLLVLQKMDLSHVDDLGTIWLSLFIIVIYLGVLRAVTMPREITRTTAVIVLTFLVCVEMFGAGLANIMDLDADVVYSSRTGYRNFIDRIYPAVELVKARDDGFYRMEKNLHRKTNDPYALGINGLSNSTSTLNAETIRLLNQLGLSSKSHWTKYLGSTPVTDTLLGVKYLIAEAEDETVSELYTSFVEWEDDLVVYENPYALSLAFAVSDRLADLDIGDEEQFVSPFGRLNAIVDAMLDREADATPVFRAAPYTVYASPVLGSSVVAGHQKYSKEDGEGSVTYTIEVDSSDPLYCYFPSKYPREADLYVNGQKMDTFFGNETFRVVQLGSFAPGEEVTVTLTLREDEIYILASEDYFFYLDTKVSEAVLPRLGANQYDISSWREDKFTGTITVTEDRQLVYTSIPYDEGWNITANGEKITPVKLLGGVIGFSLEPGEYELTLRYWPGCLTLGLLVSTAGIAAFAAAWILTERYRKKKLAAGCSVYAPIPADCAAPDPAAFEAIAEEAEPPADAEAAEPEVEHEEVTETETPETEEEE